MADEHEKQNDDKLKKSPTEDDFEGELENLLTFRKMQIPFSFRDPSTYQRFSLYQLIYSLSGLVLGLVCILGGIVLFMNGVVGSTSWTAKIIGAESNITDAAPGAVLFIVGLFVVFITRFSIKVKK